MRPSTIKPTIVKLGETKVSDFTDQLAARTSTPGGGAAAALTAAQACALIAMVANFTDACDGIKDRAVASQATLIDLGDKDATAFNSVMAAYKGKGDLESALAAAATVPSELIHISAKMTGDLEYLEEHGNKNLITDVGIAALLIHASMRASVLNIRVNTKAMKSEPDEIIIEALSLAEHIAPSMLQLAERTQAALV
ncbi:MAG: formiminotetrahydrofolate cyclodeaminase [Candidatus Azotimanducaceae bacterium]|jgi:formiminotetrahydrofolate cyclodeaminase